MYFPSATYGNLETQPQIDGFSGYQANAISVGIGGHANTTNGNTMPFEEYYKASPNDVMVIDIPVTAAGVSNWTGGMSGGGAEYYSSIDYVELSANIPSVYPTAITGLQTAYNNGINVSSKYSIGTDLSQVGWKTLWYLLGLLPYFGDVVGTYQYEQSLFNTAGLEDPVYQQVGPGNYTAGSFGMDSRMTQTWTDGSDSSGYDTYGVTTVYQLTIKSSNFDNASKLTIGAQNIEQVNSRIVSTNNGAYSSVQVDIVPAFTMSGTAYNQGIPIANRYIEFYDTNNSTAYYVKTNSNGTYRFFVNPAHSYKVYLPDEFPGPEYSGIIISPNGSTGGTLKNLNFYESIIQGYVHRANGLPLFGNGWTVTIAINGQSESVQSTEAGFYQAYVDSAGTYTINAFGNGGIAQSSSATVIHPVNYTYWGNITVIESAIDGRIMQEPINAPLPGGEVIVTLNSYRNVVYADGEGYFQAFIPNTGDYEVEALDYYANVYSSVDATAADNATYWDNLTVYNSQGGCVLYGTNVTLANGFSIPVQDLSAGMRVLAYDTNSNRFYRTAVEQIQVSRVTTVVNIDGLVSLSGLNDQPVYVKLANGTKEWLVLGAINTTMSIYDPLNGTWVQVFSYTLVPGNFTVYEVITKHGFYIDDHSLRVFDYIANGFLVDRKIG